MKISLIPAAAAHLAAVRALYEASFPPEERRPWGTIETPQSAAGPCLLIISDKGEAAGFLTVWNFATFIYVEHFAVAPDRRGAGVGAAALSALRHMYGLPVVLEAEPPSDTNPMAARRLAFYRRNGFEVIDEHYVQPPYAENLPAVPLFLMASGAVPPAHLVAETLHGEVYGVSL